MMKFKIFTVLTGFFGLVFLHAQKLEFKDKNLEKAVIENFDLNKDEAISQCEADAVNNLFLVQKALLP